MTVHIWYSGATDITGRALQAALNIEGSRDKPANIRAGDIVIGWGVKNKKDVNFANGTILNHPNAIRKNRNKFKALELMRADRDLSGNIAAFCEAGRIKVKLQHGEMVYPLIGRTNYHQGGKGFWLCICSNQLEAALVEGAQYFQSYLDIKSEYRIHVFDGKIIYAVKKIENATEAGWVKQRKEKINDYIQKNGLNLDADTVDYVLKKLYEEQQLPDRIVRSNHRGWKFSNVVLANLPAALKNAAIGSVSAIGLDFGAVDCCLDVENHPWIIEINSGPGLQGTTLNKYIAAFRARIDALQRPAQREREAAPAPRRPQAQRNAVGAAPMAEVPAGDVEDAKLRLLMNAVNSPEEARRVLDIAMGRA